MSDNPNILDERRRDGVWTANGLEADFRHMYSHPNCPGIHRVATAAGEHYAHESELDWDFRPNPKVPRQRRYYPRPLTYQEWAHSAMFTVALPDNRSEFLKIRELIREGKLPNAPGERREDLPRT